jgi:hypothetical protein
LGFSDCVLNIIAVPAGTIPIFPTDPPSISDGIGLASGFDPDHNQDDPASTPPVSVVLPNREPNDILTPIPTNKDDLTWFAFLDDTPPADRQDRPTDLFQSKPYIGKSNERRASFTYSIVSSHKSAEQVVRLLAVNYTHKPYNHLVIVKIMEELTADRHIAEWKKIRRTLGRKGIEAFWTREINRRNWLHYNFILTTNQSADELRSIFKSAFADLPHQVHVDRVASPILWSRYIVKAKTQGYDSWGKWKSDKWSSKRVLFKRDTGLEKHGTIGKFWAGGLTAIKDEANQLLDQFNANENRRYISNKPDLEKQAQDRVIKLAAMLGETATTDETGIARLITACRKAGYSNLAEYDKAMGVALDAIGRASPPDAI